jgi:hypothetical protein
MAVRLDHEISACGELPRTCSRTDRLTRPGCETPSGGDGGGETPVPISNTAVKPSCADGTAWSPCGRVGRRRITSGSLACTRARLFQLPPRAVGSGAQLGVMSPGSAPVRSRRSRSSLATRTIASRQRAIPSRPSASFVWSPLSKPAVMSPYASSSVLQELT